MPKNVAIFRSLDEAQSETGYFSVSTIMVTKSLSDKISTFIHKNNLSTFSQVNKSHTANCTYTLNFTLKENLDGSKSYLTPRGALGYYKHTLETTRYRINRGHKSESVSVHPPTDEAVEKYEALVSRTPKFMDMYFWICRKYPNDILWMDYSLKKSGLALWGADEITD